MDKPYADVRRERHNPLAKARVRGLHGHTARRRTEIAVPYASLERDHQHVNGKRFALTEFETNGLDVRRSLGKSEAWEAVPNALSEHAIQPPATRRTSDGLVLTTARLSVTGVLLPDDHKEAALRLAAESAIYSVTGDAKPGKRNRRRASWRFRVHGLTLYARPPTQPPDFCMENGLMLLPARLTCRACLVPQSAVVRVDKPQSAFSVGQAYGRPLDIDLGGPCLVAGLSTQGRHPATRRYPYVTYDDRFGWCVEGQPDWDPAERYRGPYYNVLLTESDRQRARATRRDDFIVEQWVCRYQLLWRADHGHAWNDLGTFEGNGDATSEVVARLDRLASGKSGGLVCRYLRLVPLVSKGGGALRVGVYGRRVQDMKTVAAPKETARRSEAWAEGWECEICADDETEVTYTLTEPREAFNAHFGSDGSRGSGCGCSYCRQPANGSRQRQRRAAAEEAGCLVRAVRLGTLSLSELQ